jgi:hypothetical protein
MLYGIFTRRTAGILSLLSGFAQVHAFYANARSPWHLPSTASNLASFGDPRNILILAEEMFM